MVGVYEGGGKVSIIGEGKGCVYLEGDADDDRLARELVEKAGFLATDFLRVSPEERAKLGGYARVGDFALFLVEQSQFPLILKNQTPVFLGSEINQWKPARNPDKWLMNRTSLGWELRIPWAELSERGSFEFKFVTGDEHWLEPGSEFPSVKIADNGAKNFLFESQRSGKDLFSFRMVEDERRENLDYWLNFRPEGEFGYVGRLGEENYFRVFAPRALKVDLLIYQKSDESDEKRFAMSRQEDGSWMISADQAWEQSFYKYAIFQKYRDGEGSGFEKKILDPYARAVVGRNGPGLIKPTSPTGANPQRFEPPLMKDLVILEAHLRDLLEHAELGPEGEGKSWFEKLSLWLNSQSCYLRELGVNAIEFQPLQEFDSQNRDEYHWGYMPVNYFSPESSYAKNPQRGSGLEEFRRVVDGLHDAGIAVIVDVVYNHVGIPGHLQNLDRELYFRTDEFGRLQNFSGCGNDLNCESEPVRKLVIDSLIHWVETFDVDGFRFDLAELLGVELLEEIQTVLRAIKPKIILIAEPWSFRGRLPEKIHDSGYSLWSDCSRESVFSLVRHGRRKKDVLNLLMGKHENHQFSWQSVNYVESHDDFSFVDRICKVKDFEGKEFPSSLQAMNRLALFLILFSRGIPMISAGQDFMRNKKGVRNTYQRGELNALRYEDMEKYKALRLAVRRMIRFRLSERGEFLRTENASDCSYSIWENCPDGVIALEVRPKEKKEVFLLFFNYRGENALMEFPEEWLGAGCCLSGQKIKSKLEITAYSSYLFAR